MDLAHNPPPLTVHLRPRTGPYPKMVQPILDFTDSASRLIQHPGRLGTVCSTVLKSIESLHRSIWHLIQPAYSSTEGPALAMAVDATVLARSCLEGTLCGLVLLERPDPYRRIYEIEDWRAQVLNWHLVDHIVGTNGPLIEHHEQATILMKDATKKLKLDDSDIDIVLKEFRYGKRALDPAERDRWSTEIGLSFPLPSAIAIGTGGKDPVLMGSSLLGAAQILWRYWKLSCHDAHFSKRNVISRAFFTGSHDVAPSFELSKLDFMETEIQPVTLMISLPCLVAFASAVVMPSQSGLLNDDTAMASKMLKAWDCVRDQCLLGAELWEHWVCPFLGILDPDRPSSSE